MDDRNFDQNYSSTDRANALYEVVGLALITFGVLGLITVAIVLISVFGLPDIPVLSDLFR